MAVHRRNAIKIIGGASVLAIGRASFARAAPAPDWSALRSQVGERLIKLDSPLQACADSGGAGADELFARLQNPYFLGDEPSLTQTLGWTGAWTSRASDYAVAVESAADIAAAVRFARAYRLRLVVKGGGHSYFGNSNAPGSLLIWTRRMQDVTLHDDFVGRGAAANAQPVPAATIGAGAIWGRVYEQVAVRGGRYVQGGGCLTVGVAGFVLGGGFGSLSKQFGTGAANLLEAEIVTADGRIRTVNAVRDPELFYALKGGGGGTFGVVSSLTVRTHPLPASIGAVLLSVQARSDESWRALVGRMIEFYAGSLFNPTWGEQISFAPDRTLSMTMVFHDLDEQRARSIWQPFIDWLKDKPDAYRLAGDPVVLAIPGQRFWDPAFLTQIPGLVRHDDRPGAPAGNIFWSSNLGEAGQVLRAYQSAWMPASLLEPGRRSALVDALVQGSAEWSMTLHTNKGLAGGSPLALDLSRDTATNPAVLDAFALLICAADAPPAWPGIPGHEPDLARGRRDADGVARAMRPIRHLVPDAGAYVSEADYFDVDWQRRYWGSNYAQLLRAKKRYDPSNTFRGRHTVGSST